MSDETDPTFVIDNIDMFQLDESRNFFPYCANNNPGDSMGFHAAFHGNCVDENHISIVILS